MRGLRFDCLLAEAAAVFCYVRQDTVCLYRQSYVQLLKATSLSCFFMIVTILLML